MHFIGKTLGEKTLLGATWEAVLSEDAHRQTTVKNLMSGTHARRNPLVALKEEQKKQVIADPVPSNLAVVAPRPKRNVVRQATTYLVSKHNSGLGFAHSMLMKNVTH